MTRFLLVRSELQVHEHHKSLKDICKTSYHVDGCTDLSATLMRSRCVLGDASWRIEATVEVDAVIHVRHLRWLSHERVHLADLQRIVPKALGSLTAGHFASRTDCERLRSKMFTDAYARALMGQAAAESNEHLGCSRRSTVRITGRR